MKPLPTHGNIPRFENGQCWGDWHLKQVLVHYGRQFALAENQGQSYLLCISPEYLRPPVRERLYQQLQPLLTRLEVPLLGYALEVYQGLPFIISIYPAEFWACLDQSLADQIYTQGLLDLESQQSLYHYLLNTHATLAQAGWANPGLILPWVFQYHQTWFAFHWEYCLPLEADWRFPEFYLGYHSAALKFQGIPLQQLALSSLYTCLLELLTGKSPRLWAPEPMEIDYFSAWLPARLRQELIPSNLKTWADFPWPESVQYASENLESEIRQANRYIKLAQANKVSHQFDQALDSLEKAAWYSDRDPWIAFERAQIYLAQNQMVQALTQINQALNCQPHSQFYYLRAQIYRAQELLPQAENDCLMALERWRSDDAIWGFLAEIYQAQAQLRKALKAWHNAFKLRPKPQYQMAMDTLLESFGTLPPVGSTQEFPLNQPARIHVQVPIKPQNSLLSAVPPGYEFLSASDSLPNKNTQTIVARHQSSGKICTLKRFNSPLDFSHIPYPRYPKALRWPRILTKTEPYYFSQITTSGQDLQKRLESQGPICDSEARQLINTLVVVLKSLAEGPLGPLVHGDIKPANLVQESERYFLVDLEGLAPPGQLAAHQNFTPEYAHPALRYHQQTSIQSDRFALGVSLIHLGTGIFPSLLEGEVPGHYPDWEAYALHLSAEVILAIRTLLQGDLPLPLPLKGASTSPNTFQFQRTEWLLQVAASQTAQELELLANWNPKEMKRQGILAFHLAWHARRLKADPLFFRLIRPLSRIPNLRLKTALLIAEYWIEVQEWKKAEHALKPFLGQDLQRPELGLLGMQIYFHLGKIPQALALAQQIQAKWASPEFKLWLAQLFHQAGLYLNAWKIYQQLEQTHQFNPAGQNILWHERQNLSAKMGFLKETA